MTIFNMSIDLPSQFENNLVCLYVCECDLMIKHNMLISHVQFNVRFLETETSEYSLPQRNKKNENLDICIQTLVFFNNIYSSKYINF